jgi:hypothetical protein
MSNKLHFKLKVKVKFEDKTIGTHILNLNPNFNRPTGMVQRVTRKYFKHDPKKIKINPQVNIIKSFLIDLVL